MPQIGICIPTATPDVQPTTVLDFARRAEASGADSVWTIDRVVANNAEPLISLAAAPGATSRVRLGTAVLLAPLRKPVWLAKQVATLDQISGGRAILGLGVGNRQDDFAATGSEFERRGARTEETIDLLRVVWSGQPVKHEGQFFHMDVGPIGPRPTQGTVPIWIGGSAEPVLRRVGRMADGFIGGSGAGPDGFRANWAKIRDHAQAAGRDAASITPGTLVYACVDDDRSRAESFALQYLAAYYGPRRTDLTPFLLGPADECVRKAQAYFEAGVQTMIIASFTADLRYCDRLCEDVLPRLT